jgi:hypothetical protein
MSETRNLQHPGPSEPERWREQFRDLEMRMEALREAVQEAAHSFTLGREEVDRIHHRFVEVGEQWEQLRCVYPFDGVPGQDACRVEPEVSYESEARAD